MFSYLFIDENLSCLKVKMDEGPPYLKEGIGQERHLCQEVAQQQNVISLPSTLDLYCWFQQNYVLKKMVSP